MDEEIKKIHLFVIQDLDSQISTIMERVEIDFDKFSYNLDFYGSKFFISVEYIDTISDIIDSYIISNKVYIKEDNPDYTRKYMERRLKLGEAKTLFKKGEYPEIFINKKPSST